MSKKLLISAGLIFGFVLLFLLVKFLSGGQGGPASLKITTNPASTIFLDGAHLGKTPYEDKIKAGEYTLKLVPESTGKAASWETKIKLNSGVLTYVNRDLGPQELTSAGEILTLEKIAGQSAEMAILSTPDAATVLLDNVNKGTTPLILQNLTFGDHDLEISQTGFTSRNLRIKTTAGYKLVASFQLALEASSASSSPVPVATSSSSGKLQKPYVKILDTPTGFLRVRMEPSIGATEAAQVKPGETYSLLDEESGWYQIKYQATSSGWISGQYAEKFD